MVAGQQPRRQLRSYGITEVPGLIKNWDTNFALGGPIIKDSSGSSTTSAATASITMFPVLYANKNAGNPNATSTWRTRSIKSRAATRQDDRGDPPHRAAHAEKQARVLLRLPEELHGIRVWSPGGAQCRDRGDRLGGARQHRRLRLGLAESGNVWDDREKIVQASWTSPATNKLLLEAGFSSFNSRWGGQIPAGSLTDLDRDHRKQHCGRCAHWHVHYRGWNSAASNDQQHNVWRASATYVTGAHSMKVGYQAAYQISNQIQNANNTVSYAFTNKVPQSFTLRVAQRSFADRTRYDASTSRTSGPRTG